MIDIRSLSKIELIQACEDLGVKKFRANQLWEWLWQKSARSFDEMTNLSKEFRQKLKEKYSFQILSIAHSQKSSDGTIKYAFKLNDGFLIEGVLIPTSSRVTACISSQVGCSLSCTFCATGFMKRERNLRLDEIYDQVAILKREAEREYNINLSNIVLMGMGEPLLNYANVLAGIEKITSPDGLGMSPQRITLSTAGIAKMIKKLGDDQVKFNLALSLHAANNEKRSGIMPINDINDDPLEAEELVAFARQIKCKVNLIEYNPIDLAEFQSSSSEKIHRFAEYLERNKIIVNVRRSRGKDIDAACGQLANKIS